MATVIGASSRSPAWTLHRWQKQTILKHWFWGLGGLGLQGFGVYGGWAVEVEVSTATSIEMI